MAAALFRDYYPSLSQEDLATSDILLFDNQGALAYRDCHIIGLVVAPSYRQQGLGSYLVRSLMNDCSTLTANVLFTESYNLAFWQALGFVITEINSVQSYFQLRYDAPARPLSPLVA